MTVAAPQLALELQAPTGDTLRDAGIELHAAHHRQWVEDAVELIRRVARRELSITSDDVREEATRVHFPAAPNARASWGSAMRIAVARGFLKQTDLVRKSKRPRAHAHRNPVWLAGDNA